MDDEMTIESAAERLTLADALIMVRVGEFYRYAYIPYEGSVYGVGQELAKLVTAEEAAAFMQGEFSEEFAAYGAEYNQLATMTENFDTFADMVRKRLGMSCFYLYAWNGETGSWIFKGQEPGTPGYVGPERNWWQDLQEFYDTGMTDAEVALQIYVNSQRPASE